MINVKDINKICIQDNCIKRSSYNIIGEKKPLYCSEHKKDNMINICSKLCIQDGCNKIPCYNIATEKKGIYCKEHKIENMCNIKDKKCIYDGCIKSPSYNYITEKRPLYCVEHKKDNMININSKKCIYNNCLKRANFNISTEIHPLYCNDHKLKNMINITNKKCQYSKCNNIASYGLKDKQKKQYCEIHKEVDMINLDIENKCTLCDNIFDIIFENKKYCIVHCPNKEYKFKLKNKCKYCDIEEKSNYICNDCKQLSNKKEWAVVRYIKKNINMSFIHNSSELVKECSKRRPDIMFDLLKHVVIIEIDENQHKNYEELCECSRINEIVNSIGGKSVIFIRYNPDKTYHKKKEIKINIEDKLKILIEIIKNELIITYDTFFVKIIQLFYDDDNENYNNVKELDITNIVCI